MSGPREAWEPAEGEGADSAPAPSAPPGFGKADPVAEAPAAPESQPETAPGTAGSEAASEVESGSDKAGPVPGEIRLPIGLQKPWWAADSESDSESESEPESDSGSGSDTATGSGAASDAGDDADKTVVSGAPEADEAAKEPEHTAAAPLPGTPPGTLVAGHGVPKVDTRGAVPAQPIVPINGPQYPDTDPDGIPVMSPEEAAAAAAAAEASATSQAGSPAEPKPGPAASEPRAGKDTEASAPSRSTSRPKETGQPLAAPVPTVAVAATTPPSGTPTVGTDGPDPADQPTAEQPAVGRSGAEPSAAEQPTAEQPTVATPAPAATAFSSGPLSAGPSTAGRGGGGRRTALLVGGGVLAIALIAAAGFAIAGSGGESEGRRAKAVASPGAKHDPAPSASPSAPGATASPSPTGASRIDSARSDPRPLALAEAFPTNRIDLGGRTYVRDASSVNHQCALAARGAMARALTRLRCSSVVRVTFLDKERSVAITSGIAVFPGKDAALKANDAGAPARYEWFRAMPGSRTKDIDRAGGYAASTVRGRYIAYAYAAYAGGKKARPGDPTLKEVAEQFVAYALRPVDARARA